MYCFYLLFYVFWLKNVGSKIVMRKSMIFVIILVNNILCFDFYYRCLVSEFVCIFYLFGFMLLFKRDCVMCFLVGLSVMSLVNLI